MTLSKVRLPALVDAVRVVQLARPVDAEADEELVLARRTRTTRRSSSVPLVWIVWWSAGRAARYSLDAARPTRRKKSTPISVGSPPCQAIVTSGAGATRATAGCRSRARRRPSGSGRPGRAPPWRGRSSTCSRGCRSAPSAWPARGRTRAPSVDGRPGAPARRLDGRSSRASRTRERQPTTATRVTEQPDRRDQRYRAAERPAGRLHVSCGRAAATSVMVPPPVAPGSGGTDGPGKALGEVLGEAVGILVSPLPIS